MNHEAYELQAYLFIINQRFSVYVVDFIDVINKDNWGMLKPTGEETERRWPAAASHVASGA